MKENRRREPFRFMVAIGDSITMGAAATRREYSWVYRLARLLSEFQGAELPFFNAGISGNLLSPRSAAYEQSAKPSGLERFERDVVRHRPDLVIVSYGLNDLRCGTPVEVFLEDLHALVTGIREGTGATMVLTNAYFMTGYGDHGPVWGHGDTETTRMYNGRIERYAQDHGLLHADVHGAGGEVPWVVDRDGVHPNNLGHALIAHRVFEVLASRCSHLSIKAYRDAEDYFRWADACEMPMRSYDGIRR